MEVLTHGDAEYYVAKPTASPDERFHRAISEFLDDWWRLRGRPFEAVRIVGDDQSPRAHEICDLLHRHDFPYTFHSVDSDAGRAALEAAGLNHDVGTGRHRRRLRTAHRSDEPRRRRSARRADAAGEGTYDVVVIGGGPAGLAAAVYAGVGRVARRARRTHLAWAARPARAR